MNTEKSDHRKENCKLDTILKLHGKNLCEVETTTEFKMAEVEISVPGAFSEQPGYWEYPPLPGKNGHPLSIFKSGPKKEKEKGPKVQCERPCIRKVFRPLGMFAKVFGLFPCYDLSFVEKLNERGVKFVHILDYFYSAIICCIMTTGAVICLYHKPSILEKMKKGSEDTDYYVIVGVFYLTFGMGIWSLFVFPKSWCKLIHYLDHFSHVDKILLFDGRFARDERNFSRRLLYYLLTIMVCTAVAWYCLFIVDVSAEESKELCLNYIDYLMIIIITLSVMANLIPTAFVIFFMNSIRLRLVQFNDKVKLILLPITPCCFICKSFTDYGKELDDKMLEKKSEELAFDLEKMRILHSEMTELVLETSFIFGPHLIREFIFSICGIILYSYFLLFLRGDQGSFWFVYIVLDFFVASKLVVVCWFAERIKAEAMSLLKLLQKVSALRLSPECSIQVQMFIKKLDSPVVVTASEFFNIDKRLMTTILGSITTYFFILVQQKLNDRSGEYRWLQEHCNFTTLDLLIANYPL